MQQVISTAGCMIGAEALLKRSRLFHRPIISQHGHNCFECFLVCESAAARTAWEEWELPKRSVQRMRDAGTADLVLVVGDVQ